MGSRRIVTGSRKLVKQIHTHPFYLHKPRFNEDKNRDWVKISKECGNSAEHANFGPGSDFEHWRVWAKALRSVANPCTDDIVNYYISIVEQLVGSKEEAISKIYSVATRQYYAFGAKLSLDEATNIHDLPHVIFVRPDCYYDLINKRYPWDYLVNGKPLPYDPANYPAGAPARSLPIDNKNSPFFNEGILSPQE